MKLALVSSRPISFQMDLYPPLFIPRPTVEPELFASLRPPTYAGPLTSNPIGQFGFQGSGQFGGGFGGGGMPPMQVVPMGQGGPGITGGGGQMLNTFNVQSQASA